MTGFFNMVVTKEELEFLEEQLKDFRKQKQKEKERKEIKERIKKLLSEIDDLCIEYEIDLYYDDSYLHIGDIYFNF